MISNPRVCLAKQFGQWSIFLLFFFPSFLVLCLAVTEMTATEGTLTCDRKQTENVCCISTVDKANRSFNGVPSISLSQVFSVVNKKGTGLEQFK